MSAMTRRSGAMPARATPKTGGTRRASAPTATSTTTTPSSQPIASGARGLPAAATLTRLTVHACVATLRQPMPALLGRACRVVIDERSRCGGHREARRQREEEELRGPARTALDDRRRPAPAAGTVVDGLTDDGPGRRRRRWLRSRHRRPAPALGMPERRAATRPERLPF